MAVLKSFELEGNKLSFANWISNLSPTCTPFTCMINKEKVDQVQYEWQTDTLAPATAETFEEGSQAESQPRAKTDVLSNFTATIRRAVNVSHTNEAVAAYGRKDELMYQLGKAGKELMRDIEFANLSKTEGRIGTSTQASQFSGFKALVAGVNVPAPDTHAIVHKEIPVFSDEGKIFTLKRIFDITTNLFISGSRANKIMFHPKHMFIFNDYISYNDEEPHIHRMFDGMDTKYNALISKIKDPVGRFYSLIPNRFMPENAMYFFHEEDWTQMVLRPPQRIKLGKTGSSHTVLVETEIGLRHKHPFASGVLSYAVVSRKGDLTTDKRILTAGVAIGDHATFDLSVVDVDGASVPTLPIVWDISDEQVLRIDPPIGSTDSMGHLGGTVVPKEVGYATVRAHGSQMLSNTIAYEVRPPVKTLTYDHKDMGMGQRITFTANVMMNEPADAPVPDGVEVVWRSSSDNIIFVDDTSGAYLGTTTTVATVNGEAKIKIAAKAQGTYSIWYTVDGLASSHRTITVGSAGLDMKWTEGKSVVTNGYSSNVKYEVEIRDRDGVHVGVGTPITWSSSNVGVLSVSDSTSLVGANGKATINANPVGEGSAILIADCYGDKAEYLVHSRPIIVEASVTPDTAAINEKVETVALVMDAERNPIQGARITFGAHPSADAEFDNISGNTDANGQVITNVKGLKQGIVDIYASSGSIVSAPARFNVGQGARINFEIDPTPTQLGTETSFNVTVTSQDGRAMADKFITFTTNPKIADIDSISGRTNALGVFEEKFTPVTDFDATVTAHVGGFIDTISARLTFEDRVLTYSVSGDDKKMTVGVNKNHQLTFTVRHQGVAVKNEVVEYVASDPSKVTLNPLNGGRTNDLGQSTLSITPLFKGNLTITAKVAGKTTSFTTGLLRIADPKIALTLTPNPVKLGGTVSIKAKVTDANNEAVGGVPVGFDVDPNFAPVIAAGVTDHLGEYAVNKSINDNEARTIKAYIESYSSIITPAQTLTVTDNQYDHTFSGHDLNLTAGVGITHEVTSSILDAVGSPAGNVTLEFINDTPHLIDIKHKTNAQTDWSGSHVLEVVAKAAGTCRFRTKVSTDKDYHTIVMEALDPTLGLIMTPHPVTTIEGNTRWYGHILDANGQIHSALAGTQLAFTTTAPLNSPLSTMAVAADGGVWQDRVITRPGTYESYVYMIDRPEIKSPKVTIIAEDRDYTFNVDGAPDSNKATAGIPREITVSTWDGHKVKPNLELVYENKTPNLFSMSTLSGTSDWEGKHRLVITPLKPGNNACVFTVRWPYNSGGGHPKTINTASPAHFDIQVFKGGSNLNGAAVKPSDELEFSLTLRDAGNNAIPNTNVTFVHDRMMFNGQWQAGTRTTDQFGKINFTQKIGGIGQLSIYGHVEGFPDVKSLVRTVTSVFNP